MKMNKKINKKTIKQCFFLSLFVMMFVLSGCGKKVEPTILLMSDVQKGDHPSAISCDKFAEMVYDRTDGRVKIEVYHGDTLGSEGDQMTQVTVGGIDIARISGQVSNYEPDLKAFQSLYLYDSEEAMWKVLNGSIGEQLLTADELAENNVVGLCWFSGGSRNFYNNQKEIHTPEDLAGLTIRVNTDPMIKFLENAGANPVNIAYNDIYDSIKNGVLDGAENNWPSYISTEHYTVAKYITIDQHTCIPEMLVMSKSALESLSPKDQEIVKQCAKEISAYQIQAMKDYEAEAIKTAKEAGCVITELSDEESKLFHEAGAAVNEVVSADYMDVIKWLTGK